MEYIEINHHVIIEKSSINSVVMDQYYNITITTKNNREIYLSSSSETVYKEIKNKLMGVEDDD